MTSSLLLFGFLAVLLTVLGGVIPLVRNWKEDHLHAFVCFGGGVLITTGFVYLLPDAVLRLPVEQVGSLALMSFVGLFFVEKFVMLHPCEEVHCNYHTVGITAYVGMLIHTFFDGLVMGSSFLVEGLGEVVFFAIMAHKIPSSFSLASILKKARWSSGRILLFLVFFGSMMPLGVWASSLVLKSVETSILGVAVSLSLGTFLYISTSDFLPEVHRAGANRFGNLLAFFAGMVVMMGMKFVFDHHH